MTKSKSISLFTDIVDSYKWHIQFIVKRNGDVYSPSTLTYNGKRPDLKNIVNKKHEYNKKLAVEYKNSKCARCGLESKYYEIYDFHHLNPELKIDDIGKLMYYQNFDKLKIELDKTIMVCSNCHRIIHKRGEK